MPELPEVEVVRRGLIDHAVGRTVSAATIFDARSIRRHEPGPADFIARFEGRQITGAQRRGKYLWLLLDGDEAVLCHLGMSGQFLISNPDSAATRHERVRFDLSDGTQLRFADQRIFGGLSFSAGLVDQATTLVPSEIAHIARDPFDPLFDPLEVDRRLRRRETGIKRALLDQGLISGVGNIYADESMWRARLHYARNTRHVTKREVAELLKHVTDVMAEALAQGGTSFDALYVNVNGNSGYFDRSLQAYGQEGEPCERCGTPIRRDAFMNRSSFTCPTCQPRPRNGRF